jgi:hypothetical protein
MLKLKGSGRGTAVVIEKHVWQENKERNMLRLAAPHKLSWVISGFFDTTPQNHVAATTKLTQSCRGQQRQL